MTGEWDVVVYGLAVHQETMETRDVVFGWRADEPAASFIETGGRALAPTGRTRDDLRELTGFIFAAEGGDGQPSDVRDPTNIDGTTRNALRDRVARRGLEATAAD